MIGPALQRFQVSLGNSQGGALRLHPGMLLVLLLALCSGAGDTQATEVHPPVVMATVPPPVYGARGSLAPPHPHPVNPPLGLYACRGIALAQNPKIAAARITLDAAMARANAVQAIDAPGFLAPDLPIRKQQAPLGIAIAQAGVLRAQWEVTYGVTFSYLSYLYASEQERLADAGIKRLATLKKRITEVIEAGGRRITQVSKRDLGVIDAYQSVARSRLEQAVQGKQQALGALREAMGLPVDCTLVLVRDRMPEIHPQVYLKQLLAQAVTRRPELTQTDLLVQVSDLEVLAQGSSRLKPSMKTFASSSDIHAQSVPTGTYRETYTPGAVGVEMPAFLNGSRDNRVKQAQIYAKRARAVAAKTRQLIALETKQAYLRWLEAARKEQHLRQAVKDIQQFTAQERRKFERGLLRSRPDPRRPPPPSLLEVIELGARISLFESEANQARYEALIALAGLERATAGCFQVHFEPMHLSILDSKKTENTKENSPDGEEGAENNKGASTELPPPRKLSGPPSTR